jgi:4-hydroxy-3-methylbut-2-enyl diphosphate reductase IspH
MLKEVAEKEAGISAILVENVEDLKAYDLSAYERIGVTAGA